MRIRIKFLIFLAFFLIFTPIFWIFLANFLAKQQDYEEDYDDLKPVIPGKSVESDDKEEKKSDVISKSVLLGYSNADKLSIFSAYRWKINNNKDNRITVILQSYGYLNRRVYCRYFDANHNELLPPSAATVFPEFTVFCAHQKEISAASADYVAITINKKDIPENVHAVSTGDSSKSAEFSVCLAPLFGETPKSLMLVEFLEFYKLQGADNFLIYSYNISEETEKILEFYKKQIGENNDNEKSPRIEVISIGNSTKCLNRHRCRHEMQLQDCIYRTQSYSKWVALVDLDERIMPINENSKISEILKKYSDPSIAELRFRCQWTLRYSEIPHAPLKIDNLPMVTWHNTSHVAPQNHTTKSIVRPNLVESMGVHGVLKYRKVLAGNLNLNSNLPPKLILIEPEEAVVRHYRLISGWSYFLKEAESFGEFWHFELSGKFKNALLTAVGTVIEEFAGFLSE